MNEVMEAIMPYLISILTVILGAVALRAGKFVDGLMDKYNIYDKIKANQVIVKASVEYVEQVFKGLDGEEKFRLAKENALGILADRGITISDVELDALIEQAVFQFSEGMKSNNVEVITKEELNSWESGESKDYIEYTNYTPDEEESQDESFEGKEMI